MPASPASSSSARTPRPGGGEDLAALIDGETACVVVQNPDFFGQVRDYSALAEACHASRRAAGRRRHRDRVARRDQAARRDGRRHRRRRGPVDRQRAEFRRALCRAVRHAREIRAPDAGPARRRDRRCRRPARLGADPVDARAAYPPREGDEQHLHQFRPVRARLHDPSGAARRGRADAAGARSTTPHAVALAERLERVPGVELVNRQLLQRIHAAPAAPGRAGGRRAGRARRPRRRAGRAASARTATELADLLLVAATETDTDEDIDALRRRRLREVLR